MNALSVVPSTLHDRSLALVKPRNLYCDLNRQHSKVLVRQLAESAVTLLNGDQLLRDIDRHQRTAVVSISEPGGSTAFQESLTDKFSDIQLFELSTDVDSITLAEVCTLLDGFEQIIVSVHDTRARPRNRLDIPVGLAEFVATMADQNAIVCFFANPYALVDFPGIERAQSLLICYQNDEFMQRAAARLVLGEKKSKGLLPVSVDGLFKSGEGIR